MNEEAILSNYEIKPGYGVDVLSFGLKRSKIEEMLGAPDLADVYEYPEEGDCHSLFYYELGIDLSFESEDDYRLSLISFESDEYHIAGKIRIGMSKADLLKSLEELNYSKPEMEIVEDDDKAEYELMVLDKESIILWLREDVLAEIQISTFWEDDSTIIWPE